jgi:hypothetical protein
LPEPGIDGKSRNWPSKAGAADKSRDALNPPPSPQSLASLAQDSGEKTVDQRERAKGIEPCCWPSRMVLSATPL